MEAVSIRGDAPLVPPILGGNRSPRTPSAPSAGPSG